MRLDFRRRGRRLGSYIARESLLVPILVLELAVVGLVPPRGDFPLNDDWIYAAMVPPLVTDFTYVNHPYTVPIAVAQVVWGALFCWVFGLSYVTLRVSTLVLAAIGGWAVAKSAMACGLSRGMGLWCAFITLANPIYMNLSYTFMTDVPFCAITALSLLFYLRSFEKKRLRDLFLGSLFAALAFLVRQFGLVIAIGYLGIALGMGRKRAAVASAKGLAAFAIPWLGAAAIFVVWRTVWARGIPVILGFSHAPLHVRFLQVAVYIVTIVVLMGLFLLPMTCLRMASVLALRERWPRHRFLVIALFGLLSAVVFAGAWKHPLPAPGNVLNTMGTGTFDIADVSEPVTASWETAIRAGWWIATVLAVLSGAVIVTDVLYAGLLEPLRYAVSAKKTATENGARFAQRLFLFLWGFAVFAMSDSPLIRFVFDRYTLPILLPLSILYAGFIRARAGPIAKAAAIGCGTILLLFSVAGIHDYLAWNEARWKGLDFLRYEMGVPPERINGGYEFNGQYTIWKFIERTGLRDFWQGHRGQQWWVLDDTYAVWLAPLPGYREIKRFPYFLWIGWKEYPVYVLQRAS